MISGALPSLRRLPHDPATPKSLTHIAMIQLLPLLAGEGGDGGEPWHEHRPLPTLVCAQGRERGITLLRDISLNRTRILNIRTTSIGLAPALPWRVL